MTSSTRASNLLEALPGRYYTDPAIFELDQRRIFQRSWHCVGRVDALTEAGQFYRVDLGEESVLVVRGGDGEPRAMRNLCRHRGAQLCTEESGSFRTAIRCAYHSWSYDLDGRLLAAPNMREMPDLVKADYGLHPVRTEQWLGYLWLNLDPEAPPLAAQVEPQLSERLGDGVLERYEIGRLGVAATISYQVASNWKAIIENFMECYHCATIHPELTEVLPEFAKGLAVQYYVGHGAAFGEAIEGFTVDGSAGFDTLPGLTPEQDQKYYAMTVRPTVFINLVPDHIIFHRMYPMAVDRTIVECDWLYAPDVVAEGRDVEHSVELFHRVNVQDFDACERTQPAMSSRAYRKGGVLVPVEHHIAEFHEWVLSHIGETEVTSNER